MALSQALVIKPCCFTRLFIQVPTVMGSRLPWTPLLASYVVTSVIHSPKSLQVKGSEGKSSHAPGMQSLQPETGLRHKPSSQPLVDLRHPEQPPLQPLVPLCSSSQALSNCSCSVQGGRESLCGGLGPGAEATLLQQVSPEGTRGSVLRNKSHGCLSC